jgi:hypothetical protein
MDQDGEDVLLSWDILIRVEMIDVGKTLSLCKGCVNLCLIVGIIISHMAV